MLVLAVQSLRDESRGVVEGAQFDTQEANSVHDPLGITTHGIHLSQLAHHCGKPELRWSMTVRSVMLHGSKLCASRREEWESILDYLDRVTARREGVGSLHKLESSTPLLIIEGAGIGVAVSTVCINESTCHSSTRLRGPVIDADRATVIGIPLENSIGKGRVIARIQRNTGQDGKPIKTVGCHVAGTNNTRLRESRTVE